MYQLSVSQVYMHHLMNLSLQNKVSPGNTILIKLECLFEHNAWNAQVQKCTRLVSPLRTMAFGVVKSA